jgi:hypothetical protein
LDQLEDQDRAAPVGLLVGGLRFGERLVVEPEDRRMVLVVVVEVILIPTGRR